MIIFCSSRPNCIDLCGCIWCGLWLRAKSSQHKNNLYHFYRLFIRPQEYDRSVRSVNYNRYKLTPFKRDSWSRL